MKLHTRPRAAFTLLELIVVITLIILLATLSVAAVLRVQDSQRETNTEIQLRKIQMGLDQRLKVVVDQIKAEDPPEVIKNLTKTGGVNNDNDRAKALHMKLRLRSEFPQTFAEADPAKFALAYPALWVDPVGRAKYGPKQLFASAIANLADTADRESAVLLPMILSQTGGGIVFDVDTVGGTQTVLINGTQPRELKAFMDMYGQPIAFRRWADAIDDPVATGIVAELSQPPYAPKAPAYPDVQDPAGRLGPAHAATWGANRNLALNLFISQVPNSRPLFNANVNPFDGLNRGPYVFSAGKDKTYGNENDIFGFRLQGTGKGAP